MLVDSGAFTELSEYGAYRHGVEEYARELHRLHCEGVVAIFGAVAQDYMCEPFMIEKTGLSVADHQRLTIERYDALVDEMRRLFDGPPPFPIMPVLQGFDPTEYAEHVMQYGDRLTPSSWVGVGSVCKRNGDPDTVASVLSAIRDLRPDLLLHGFGVKLTSLLHPQIRELLSTADSMAWSYSARRKKGSANDWRDAEAFAMKIAEAVKRRPHDGETGCRRP